MPPRQRMSAPAREPPRTFAATPEGCCHDFAQAVRVNRRSVLSAGGMAALGLGLDGLLHARAATAAAATAPIQGRARSCILIFMWGGPSQLDTFDMKPKAPAEIRGSFQPIATSTPGLQICEHFQRLAPRMDRVALVRTLTHTDPAHLSSGHLAMTGHLAPVVNSDAEPPSDRDSPHIGSVMARLRGSRSALPPFVTLPWLTYHPAAPGGHSPGQNGGWLGRRHDPLLVTGDPSQANWTIPELALRDDITLSRLDSRRSLLGTVDAQCAMFDAGASGDFKQQAFDLLAGAAAREAFDIAAEPERVRTRYGRNIHGQCVLLARRLVERGVPLVSVNWHNDGRNFWDTHGDNFNRLKNDLIPPARRDAGRLGRRIWPQASDHHGERGPRALAAVLQRTPGRGRHSRRRDIWRKRRQRRRTGARPGRAPGFRGHDLHGPGRRPGPDADQRRRSAGADLRGPTTPLAVWLSQSIERTGRPGGP
jgi:Protein of unknown function (DUF1501)